MDFHPLFFERCLLKSYDTQILGNDEYHIYDIIHNCESCSVPDMDFIVG